MFIQTTSQLPSVQNDVLTGQYAGLLCIIAWSIPRFFNLLFLPLSDILCRGNNNYYTCFPKIVYNVCIQVYSFFFFFFCSLTIQCMFLVLTFFVIYTPTVCVCVFCV